MKIFISQPMCGWTNQQIDHVRHTVMKKLRKQYGSDTQFAPLVQYDGEETETS